jgi:UPF0042 nucleotide-binding protein
MSTLPLVIVTGPSGAGRTTALKALEDQGYQIIDNLPLLMMPALVGHFTKVPFSKNMVVVGLESIDFTAPEAEKLLKDLRANPAINLRIVYLECDEETILKRYNESRRPHPIDAKDLQTAVRLEKQRLTPLKKIAEIQLNTTDLQHYFQGADAHTLKIQLLSFSYKKSLPKNADLIIDVRFLSNPFYEKHLQPLSGKDKDVQHYIKQDQRWMIVEHHFKEFLINAILGYKEQGRFYLTIAFGCTGGQHRSVFVAEFFHSLLKKLQYDCVIEHRDL